MQPPIGLIAGGGGLPLLEARGMRAAGRRIVGVGLRGHFDPALPDLCDVFKTAGIVQLGRWIRLLRRYGAVETVMVGTVRKTRMYDPFRFIRYIPDLRGAQLWFMRVRNDRRPDAVLSAVADEMAQSGITMIDSTQYIGQHMTDPGTLGRVKPTADQSADMQFALPIIKRMGDLDIGQSIAVRDREVIAVEAIEGTDRMIERAGSLCRVGGWTLVKVAKPQQDMRFDVPTVGPTTIEMLHQHRAKCLALEAGKVIMVDREQMLALADKHGIAVVGIDLAAAD
ncbi:MAG: hypothetical protein CMJ49_01275 [Planctomycetaceae bacterium]|nr:hypothetical protein [Planctomycetaceae bacterium]